jgi:hypothetical protein
MSDYSSYTETPNNSTAMISLVAGILGLTFFPFIGSIVAIIAGSRAKTEIAESHGAQGGEGLAQAGIVMGWIGVGLGAVTCCIALVVIAMSFGIFGLAASEMGTLLPQFLTII